MIFRFALRILSASKCFVRGLSGLVVVHRLPGMVRYAAGGNKDLPEIWVDTEDKRKHVQVQHTHQNTRRQTHAHTHQWTSTDRRTQRDTDAHKHAHTERE